MVMLNGTPLNGSQLHGRWMAPTALPTLPTPGFKIDNGTYNDVFGTESPRHDASWATENVAQSEAAPAPWPAPDPFEVERARLVSEIATANERAASVRESSARREADRRAALRAEFVAARRVLDEMERQHAAKIAAVRKAAETDVKRILDEARLTTDGRIEEASTSQSIGAGDAD